MSDDARTAAELAHVARGAVLGLGGSAFAAAAALGIAVVVTRGLAPADAGRYFVLTTVFALLVSASTFGTDAGLSRFLLRLEAEGRPESVPRAVAWAVVPTLALSCALAVALAVGAAWAADHGWVGVDARLLGWLALAVPAAVVADVLLAATRGLGRIGPTVVVDRCGRSGIQVALAVVALAAGGGLALVLAGWAVAYLVSASAAAVVAGRAFRTRGGRAPAPSRPESHEIGRRFWSFTWPRGVGALAQMGIQKVDVVLVAVLLTPVDAALYAAATRFVPLGQMAVQALQQVLQPRFTAILLADDRRTLTEVFGRSTTWSVLLAWPLYLVVAGGAASYLSVFGAEYVDAEPVVVVLGLTMLLAVATGPVDTLLLMAGRSGLSMANALLALALDLVLCLILVPRWGITGAAAAWGAAVAVRCGLATWQVHRELGVGPAHHAVRACLLPLACFGVPHVVVAHLAGPDLGWWAATAVAGGVVYLLLLSRRDDLGLHLLTAPGRRSDERRRAVVTTT